MLPAEEHDQLTAQIAQLQKELEEKEWAHQKTIEGIRTLNTNLKKKNEDLKCSSQKFRQVFEQLNDGIILYDTEGNIVDVNLKAQAMWGYSHAEFLNLTLSDLHFLHGAEKKNNPALNFSDLQNNHTTTCIFEVEFQRKDASVFYAEVSEVGMGLEGQALVLGVFREITQRKEAEADQERLHEQLMDASRQAGMADLASGVLHNVGNILTSVTVSLGVVRKILRQASVKKVQRTAALIQTHAQNLSAFLTQDPKGQKIPEYLSQLGDHLVQEQGTVAKEIQELTMYIEHINQVIQTQQGITKSAGHHEPVDLYAIMEQALFINSASLDRHHIDLVREYEPIPPIVTDRHQVLQILVNLISNAKYAVLDHYGMRGQVSLKIGWAEDKEGIAQIQVQDNGTGIKPEHLTQIFTQRFTTKKAGHGFGLHSATLIVQNLGGSLVAHSDGVGQGATFTLELPAKVVEASIV